MTKSKKMKKDKPKEKEGTDNPKSTGGTSSVQSSVAREDDGTIQITFRIPFEIIDKNRNDSAKLLGEEITIPGFRKGKAPLDKLIKHIPENKLLQETLNKILPKLLQDIINDHKIKPAIYPKFELLNAEEGQTWQIRAITCEIPEFELGEYKSKLTSELKSEKIWTPDKGDPTKDTDKNTESSRQELEQKIVENLLKNIQLTIPKVLVDEEVNTRLSNLLDKIEKLGLNLDSYLASVGKTPQSLRSEYEKQASDTLALDLILNKIAQTENIEVSDDQIQETIQATSNDPEVRKRLESEDQKRMIKAVLTRRKALDTLVSLLN